MTTLRFTITGRYEAVPKHYDTKIAARMAEIDQASYDDREVSVEEVLSWADERDIQVRIEADS
jgi:hypothetical protein